MTSTRSLRPAPFPASSGGPVQIDGFDAIQTVVHWKSLRLSAARKDLEKARRGMTVAAVAMKWGIFRLGHFSGDYRAMFGEKPSETLRRARGRAHRDPTSSPAPGSRSSRDAGAPGA